MEETTDRNDELKTEPKAEPEKPLEENIPAAKPETVNPKPKTEAMEVHHHPDLHHKKKNFREYFFEFLMIFLAVSMGFIAENIRENFSEEKTAHKILESYRNDLLLNERRFKTIDSVFTSMLPVYDSIVSIFYQGRENIELPALSRLVLKGQKNTVITINTSAYQQMVSSGSMRYINNWPMMDSIAKYNEEINSIVNYNDRIITTLNNALVDIGKIEDMHDFWRSENRTLTSISNYQPEMDSFSLTKEQRRFLVSYNKLFSVQAIVVTMRMKKLISMNQSLVTMIDKELDK